MEKRPVGSNYEAWFAAALAKYPDAVARTTGEYGWTTLGTDQYTGELALIPHNSGPYYTDVSSRTYSRQRLIGTFDHTTNKGKYFAPVDL